MVGELNLIAGTDVGIGTLLQSLGLMDINVLNFFDSYHVSSSIVKS